MPQPMVFGIGLAKTGTSSLNKALELLGLRSIHYPDPALMLAGQYDRALAGFDAATDITVSAFFPLLDRHFPGSKFILTLRDFDQWMVSIDAHMQRISKAEWTPDNPKGRVREMVFDTVGWDRDLFARSYHRHTQRVRDYFRNRPQDLLVADFCAGCGWEPLCTLLNRAIPSTPFPHENQRPDMQKVRTPGRAA